MGLTNGQPVVSWSPFSAAFELESITNPGGTSWSPVTNPVVLLPEGNKGVILPATIGAKSFRGCSD